MEKLKNMFKNDESSIINYLDSWIYYALIIRDIRRKNLNWSQRMNYLSDYLII